MASIFVRLVSVAIAFLALACGGSTPYELKTPKNGVVKSIDLRSTQGRVMCGNEEFFVLMDRFEKDRVSIVTSGSDRKTVVSTDKPYLLKFSKRERCGFSQDAKIGSELFLTGGSYSIFLKKVSPKSVTIAVQDRDKRLSLSASYPLTDRSREMMISLGVSPWIADNIR